MNRFKIRVWDNYKKCYLGEIEKTIVAEDGTEYTFPAWIIPNGGIITLTGIDRNPRRFVKEQGTTGEDKNGKQIFEGDRCRIWDADGEEYISEIKWRGALSVDVNNVDWDYSTLEWAFDRDITEIEVIGNIHEEAAENDLR